MPKYGNEFYLQLPRVLWQEPYCRLSMQAKWLYVTLKELEHRFTGGGISYFWRMNHELAADMGVSDKVLKRAKKELLATDLVESWQVHFKCEETGKLSEKHVTAYQILK